jgi:hypothetical protein
MNEAEMNALYERNKLDIFAVYQKYEQAFNGCDAEKKLELKLGECDELIDLLQQQKRVIQFKAGKPVEPEVHFAKAVVVGIVGGGTG